MNMNEQYSPFINTILSLIGEEEGQSHNLNWRGVEKLTSEDIRSYLIERKWQHIPYQDTRLKLFESPDKEAIVLLPGTSKLSDYQYLVQDAIHTLAQINDLPEYVLLLQFLERKAQAQEKIASLKP